MGAILSKSRDPTETECHESNCRWDNGIFTPSFNSEGEVASIPLKQREEQRQAFSKERGAGKQGGTHNLQSRGKVRQVHPASKWDSVSGQVLTLSSQPSAANKSADCQTSRQVWNIARPSQREGVLVIKVKAR